MMPRSPATMVSSSSKKLPGAVAIPVQSAMQAARPTWR